MMSPIEVRAPRLNANSDEVKISRLLVKPGDAIAAGALLAEIESDKTTFEVCAEQAGFVVRIEALEGATVAAGGAILWIGESPDAKVNGAAALAKEAGPRDRTGGHGKSPRAAQGTRHPGSRYSGHFERDRDSRPSGGLHRRQGRRRRV